MASERSHPGEDVIFEGPVSQWCNVGNFLVSFFGLLLASIARQVITLNIHRVSPEQASLLRWSPAILAGLSLLYGLACWWRVRFTIYRVTTERVEVERGLVSKRIDNIDLFRINDVQLRIGILDRLQGIGTVVLRTTDETHPRLDLRGVPNPRRIYERVKTEALRADRRRGVIHVER
ncbi:MAG: PH domain-containing protein [Phycisphaerae bacterium]|jgi:uncharacterized membrane protein YdbT with pleckstrin-like domain